MADVTITVLEVATGVATVDLVGSGASVNAGQTFAVAIADSADKYMFVFEEEGSGAATVTVDAGDLPPSHRQGLGGVDVTLATSDMKALVVEGQRHVQSDGTITGSVATNDTYVRVIHLPNTN